jgi:hypothetical protein
MLGGGYLVSNTSRGMGAEGAWTQGHGTESKMHRGCVEEASNCLDWASLQVLCRHLAVKPINCIG